ncbi:MAG TPA: threonine/serine exporter [Firmicutes bacterium]|jgi:uncharacterized membrane protein YjjB (DUF3815 family)|nr:threonine/serine exporter [Bacillota bacterium]
MSSTDIFLQFIAAFLASGAFAMLYKIPLNLLFFASLVGAVGWMGYLVTVSFAGSIVATFIAAAIVSLLAELFSRMLKTPATTLAVPGIIPLVPGMRVYRSMEYFLLGDNVNGLDEVAMTLLVAGAIALGLAVVGSMFRLKKR